MTHCVSATRDLSAITHFGQDGGLDLVGLDNFFSCYRLRARGDARVTHREQLEAERRGHDDRHNNETDEHAARVAGAKPGFAEVRPVCVIDTMVARTVIAIAPKNCWTVFMRAVPSAVSGPST